MNPQWRYWINSKFAKKIVNLKYILEKSSRSKNQEKNGETAKKSLIHSEFVNNQQVNYLFATQIVIHGEFLKMIMNPKWITERNSTFIFDALIIYEEDNWFKVNSEQILDSLWIHEKDTERR